MTDKESKDRAVKNCWNFYYQNIQIFLKLLPAAAFMAVMMADW